MQIKEQIRHAILTSDTGFVEVRNVQVEVIPVGKTMEIIRKYPRINKMK